MNLEYIDDGTLDTIWRMYQITYGGMGTKYEDVDQLIRRKNCGVLMINKNGAAAGILYEVKSGFNKLSVSLHEGTYESKNLLSDMKAVLLVTPGNILETGGAPDHVIRTRYNITHIADYDLISRVLGESIRPLYNGWYQRRLKDGSTITKRLYGIPCTGFTISSREKSREWVGEGCNKSCDYMPF